MVERCLPTGLNNPSLPFVIPLPLSKKYEFRVILIGSNGELCIVWQNDAPAVRFWDTHQVSAIPISVSVLHSTTSNQNEKN